MYEGIQRDLLLKVFRPPIPSTQTKYHDFHMKFQVNEEIERIERTISESKAKKKEGEEEEDALDAYMSSVSETTVTTGAVPEIMIGLIMCFNFGILLVQCNTFVQC